MITDIKNIEQVKELKKINRKKFFFYSGSAIFGLGMLTKLPFRFFQSKILQKPSIKITENPNAVRRKKGQKNIG